MHRIQMPLNQPVPRLGPQNYRTYAMRAPLRTHWRPATCEEYECLEFLNGFVITIDLSTELGQKQHHYLTHDKTRRGSLQRISLELVKIVYGPGNRCFNWGEHKVPIGRPPLLIAREGDWRGNPRGIVRRHTRVEDWVEDSANNIDRITTLIQRG